MVTLVPAPVPLTAFTSLPTFPALSVKLIVNETVPSASLSATSTVLVQLSPLLVVETALSMLLLSPSLITTVGVIVSLAVNVNVIVSP